MAAKVLFSRTGPLRVVTLNSPKTLNALDLDMVRLLSQRFSKYSDNETIGAIILEGAKGTKAPSFCAGGDIVSLHNDASTPETRDKCTQFFLEEYTLNWMLKHHTTPIVSILDGITMGGGVGVSVHGAFRIATENTVFAMPECSIGFFPDVGLTHLLPSLPIGTYLGMTGERLKGREVVGAGIATHFVPESRLPALKQAISDAVIHHVGNSSPKIVELREVVQMAIETCAEEHTDPELTSVVSYQDEISQLFDVDLSKANAINIIVERLEESDSSWAESALKKIQTSSPFALQATRELFAHSKQGRADFSHQLSREFEATKAFMAHPDFVEGVSAAVIERRRPNFQSNDDESWIPIVQGGIESIDWRSRVEALK